MTDILVIDDLRIFDDGSHYTYARTLKDGQRAIDDVLDGELTYDELWLDHDLGMSGDIRPIVMRLVKLAVVEARTLDVHRIHVITANPVGREWITTQLMLYYKVY